MAKVKELDSPDISILKNSYEGCMGIVGVNNKLLFPLVSCKEEIYHSIGKYYVFKDDPVMSLDMLGHGEFGDEFDKNKSHVLFYVNPSKPFSKARRINRVLKLLAEKQGLEKPKVYIIKDSNAVMIKPDKWYFGSPIALSGFLTFARGAAKTSFVFNTLSNFIVKIIKNDENYCADGEHFGAAKHNKNLRGFLDKTLKVFSLKPLEAYSLGKLNNDIPYDGIANHGQNDYDSIANGIWSKNSDDCSDDYYDCTCDYCRGY